MINSTPLGALVENESIPFQFGNQDVVFINTGDVRWGRFLHSDTKSPVGLPGQAKKAINEGHILLSEIRPGNGRFAKVDFEPKNYVVSTKFMVLNQISPYVNADFLYLQLTSPMMLCEFQRIAESRSGTFPQITFESISHLPISVPPLPEQIAVASFIGAVDKKIELNRKTNQTLESMAQALFKSWFVDFDPIIDNALAAGNEIPEPLAAKADARRSLREQGGDKANHPHTLPKHIRQLFPSRFQFTEELGWIPDGWELSNIGQEFDVTMGQSPPGSTYNEEGRGLPFFQGRADFGFRYPSNRIYCDQPKRLAKKNDTLISVRAPVGDVNMASTDCCIGRGVGAIRHKTGSISFSYYSMLQLKELLERFNSEGTVFGSINQKDLKKLPSIRCPTAIVNRFELLASSYDKRIAKSSQQILSLSDIRDNVLPKLLSGELRIPEAEKVLDEAPA